MSLSIPLAVRLQTRSADRHVTRDLMNLRFRDEAPGGFATCQLQLMRPLDLDAAELEQYGRLWVYDGATGETVWEGYQDPPVPSAGSDGEITSVTATGPKSRAADQQVPLIYVDNDYSAWKQDGSPAGELSNAQEDTIGSTFNQHRVPRGVQALTNATIVDAVYRSIGEAGQKVARIQFRWDSGITDPGWSIRIFVGSTIAYSTTANAAGSGGTPLNVTVVTDFPNDGVNTIATCRWQRIGVNGPVGDDVTYVRFGTPLRITAMRLRADGTEVTSYSRVEVLSSEVVADLLGRLLPTYAGAAARVDTTAFLINQLAYPNATTPADVLGDLMTIDPAYYWAVWEGVDPFGGLSRFEWRQWPTSVRYELSVVDGYQPSSAAADLFDKVRVRYIDQSKRARTALRTQTVQELVDAGFSRSGFVDLGSEMGSLENAQQAGDGFLADHASVPNAGTVTVSRPVLDLQTGRMVPPYLIRPGHLCRVRGVAPTVDTLNGTARDGSTIFRIAAKDYDAADGSASLELDTYPRTIAQAIARVRTTQTRARRL